MSAAGPKLFLLIVFSAILVVPGLIQGVHEIRAGKRPRILDVFRESPTPANLRAFEDDLQTASVTARLLRPWMQAAQFILLGDAGAKAVVGRDGWLFYKPGVNYLTQRPSPKDSTPEQALSAVRRFRDALAERGIRLLVLPVPNKESIYPDKLSALAKQPHGIYSVDTRRFIEQSREAGIEVIDLFTLFQQARLDAKGPLYLAQDSHWSTLGMTLAAAAVAQQLSKAPAPLFELRSMPIRRLGDLVQMLRSPPLESWIPPESVECSQVIRLNSGTPYTDDPESDVLLLGDSILRIYERDQPTSAGFIAHLALALQRPLASIVNDGGASTLVRQELFRRPKLLARTKAVVWEFTERDLRLGTEGWQILDLPPAPALSKIQ